MKQAIYSKIVEAKDDIDLFLEARDNGVMELLTIITQTTSLEQDFFREDYASVTPFFDKMYSDVINSIQVEPTLFPLYSKDFSLADYLKTYNDINKFEIVNDAIDIRDRNTVATRYEWVQESIKKYHNFREIYVKNLAKLVTQAQGGRSLTNSQLRAMAARLDITKEKLTRLLDSQIRKLEAQVISARALAKGIRYAIWVTKRDSLVRPSHRIKEGVVYDIRRGLNGILPGEEPNCRCRMRLQGAVWSPVV